MGSKNSLLMPCCDYDLPSSRVCLKDFGLSSTGPIKPQRKKCSVATSETISIIPLPLASNRSSVTEFVVNRSESLTDTYGKTPERLNQDFYSVPCSPGRYKSSYCFANSRNSKGKNIVSEIRSRSVVSSPQTKPSTNFPEDLSNFNFMPNPKYKKSLNPRSSLIFETSSRRKS